MDRKYIILAGIALANTVSAMHYDNIQNQTNMPQTNYHMLEQPIVEQLYCVPTFQATIPFYPPTLSLLPPPIIYLPPTINYQFNITNININHPQVTEQNTDRSPRRNRTDNIAPRTPRTSKLTAENLRKRMLLDLSRDQKNQRVNEWLKRYKLLKK